MLDILLEMRYTIIVQRERGNEQGFVGTTATPLQKNIKNP